MKKTIVILAAILLASCEKEEVLCDCRVQHQQSTNQGVTYQTVSWEPLILTSVNGDCQANVGYSNFDFSIPVLWKRDYTTCK